MDNTVRMSQEDPKKTLKQIFQLLKQHWHDFSSISGLNNKVIMRSHGIRKSRGMKSASCPTCSKYYCFENRATSPILPDTDFIKSPGGNGEETLNPNKLSDNVLVNVDISQTTIVKESIEQPTSVALDQTETIPQFCSTPDEELDIFATNQYLIDHILRLMRENVDLKIQMQEIQEESKNINKKKSDDDNIDRHLCKIDEILTKVLRSQTTSENLCDKLCDGLDKLKLHVGQLPVELKIFCDRIHKTVGPEYRQIGLELGLALTILDRIEDEYTEDEERLYQTVLEWSKQSEMPSIHDLVAACYNVNPDILKRKPLSNAKAKILQNQYGFLLDEMMEFAVIPHLVSVGVMTLKLSRYVLKPPTRDIRISRLISVVCTRENGFDELINALDSSEQQHVSAVLKEAAIHSVQETEERTDEIKHRLELVPQLTPARTPPVFRRRTCASLNDLDSDDGRSVIESEASYSSSPSSSDPYDILWKIFEIIQKAGLSRQLSK